MTKMEYFNSQGFYTCSPAFNPNEEADDEFMLEVDEIKRILLAEEGDSDE